MGAQVAVAVVSWNTRELLERCLASLEADARSELAEVWVVDNASSDGSADAARAHSFARVLSLSENRGFAGAVDLVARASSASWIACANADVALADGALATLVAAARAHADVGAVAPRLILPDGSTQQSVHAFPTVGRMAIYQSGLGRRLPRLGDRLTFAGSWNPDRPRYVDWAIGAFLVVRRDAWEAVGGMGSEAALYGEDLDLCWRLRQAGWRAWYEPRAIVHHADAAATAKAWGDHRHVLRSAATYHWLLRRRGAARAAATAAVNVIGAAARAAGAYARDRRNPAWKQAAREAWLHADGLRRALRRRG